MLQTGKKCAECETEFAGSKKNQKYCTRTCAVKATNKKLLQNYHDKKLNQGRVRVCATCPAKLSAYNPDDKCSSCQVKQKDADRMHLLKELGLFDYIQE